MQRPRSRLLTGEQRPSNLIYVTVLRLAREINSGRLREQRGREGGGEGELSRCAGASKEKERCNKSTAV